MATISWTSNSLTSISFPRQNLTFFPEHRERLLRCKRKWNWKFKLKIEIGNGNRKLKWLFSWQLMPDLWFYGILNSLKKGRVSYNFRKTRAIVLKLHTNILYRSRNVGIEFGQNRLVFKFFQILNFLRIFSKLSNLGKFRF